MLIFFAAYSSTTKFLSTRRHPQAASYQPSIVCVGLIQGVILNF
jgi:hypothetical protein